MNFEIRTPQTAPEASRSTLADVEKAYTFIPNLYGNVITALKTIMNDSNPLAGTPLNAAFAGHKWTRPD